MGQNVTQLLNNKRVLINATGMLRRDDILQLSDKPWVIAKVNEMGIKDITIVPAGLGFEITASGFDPGTSLSTVATGTLAGENIRLMIGMTRGAELDGGALYRVDCLIAVA